MCAEFERYAVFNGDLQPLPTIDLGPAVEDGAWWAWRRGSPDVVVGGPFNDRADAMQWMGRYHPAPHKEFQRTPAFGKAALGVSADAT